MAKACVAAGIPQQCAGVLAVLRVSLEYEGISEILDEAVTEMLLKATVRQTA